MKISRCFCGGAMTDTGQKAIEDYTPAKLSALYECNTCNSIYIDAVDRGDLILDYEKAKPNDLNDEKQRFISSLKRNLLLSSWKKILEPAKNGTIIDFGCGDGNLALYIKEQFPGRSVMAVDLPSRVPPLLKGQDIRYETIGNFLSSNEKADCILLRHVLEHIEHPVEFIKALVSKLTPGGRIIIEIPNIDSFWRKVLGKKWMGYYSPYHYWVYSQKGMHSLIDEEMQLDLIGFTNPPHGGYLAMLGRKKLAKSFVAISSMIFYSVQFLPVLVSRKKSEGVVYVITKK